jgi:hypothetical protein
MDALRAIHEKIDALNLPEGDMLMLMNNLKTVYQALPQNVKTVDVDTPAVFQQPPTEMEEIERHEGLWRPGLMIRHIQNTTMVDIIRLLYKFFTVESMTSTEFDDALRVILIPTPDVTILNRNIRTNHFNNQTLVLANILVICLGMLSDDVAENLQDIIDNGDLPTVVRTQLIHKLMWKINTERCLNVSCNRKKDKPMFNLETHFDTGLYALANIKENIPIHAIKVCINLEHRMFVGDEKHREGQGAKYETLNLATSYIKLGGHSYSATGVYQWVAFRALLGDGATSAMIKVLKRNFVTGWKMTVSGITAKTRNKIRSYDCEFATAQYMTKLNNGGD